MVEFTTLFFNEIRSTLLVDRLSKYHKTATLIILIIHIASCCTSICCSYTHAGVALAIHKTLYCVCKVYNLYNLYYELWLPKYVYSFLVVVYSKTTWSYTIIYIWWSLLSILYETATYIIWNYYSHGWVVWTYS